MQIVIDISEERFGDIQRIAEVQCESNYFKSVEQIIANGTPLPKGHGDLIDVNRKITVPIYDDEFEEYGEKTLTVLEVLNKWSDEGVTAEDVIIPAESEGKDDT